MRVCVLLRSLPVLLALLGAEPACGETWGDWQNVSLARRHRRQVEFGAFDASRDSGPWGFWETGSACSRSCGGGVSLQVRRCRQQRADDSSECSGPDRRYRSCNVQDCPSGSRDFREEQCSGYDSISFEGRFYRWEPYLKTARQCELNCKPQGERFYYRHRSRVVDGTSCGEDQLGVCVDGECRTVGCDRLLSSSLQEDQCRVCGGDGSTCHTGQGTFDSNRLQQGYNDILLIPKGATHILIEEVKASSNYLAIRNLTGHFYLNGNWRIDAPSSRTFAGSRFHYERRRTGLFGPERIRALGPTTEALYVVLLYQERNRGVRYKYSVPQTVSEAGEAEYDWMPGEWSDCSTACGTGERQRELSCVRQDDQQEVSRDLCDVLLKPDETEACEKRECPASWMAGNWTECFADCGGAGFHFRAVTCGQQVNDRATAIVDDDLCAREAVRPSHSRPCSGQPCATYHVGAWSPCDRLCGDGKRTRRVLCHRTAANLTQLLPDSDCAADRPDHTQPCSQRPCEGVDWVASDWSQCAESCGQTVQTRSVQCANEEGRVFEADLCHDRRRPVGNQSCAETTDCAFSWYATQWSKCSVTCGSGLQSRRVFCGAMDESGLIASVDEANCDRERRYQPTRPCQGTHEPPCPASWRTSPWGPCSASCEKGSQTRKVFCSDETGRVELAKCDSDGIPFTFQDCNDIACADAELLKQLEVATQTYVPSAADDECLLDYDYDDDDASGSGSGERPGDGRQDPVSFADLLERALDSFADQRGSGVGSGDLPFDLDDSSGDGSGATDRQTFGLDDVASLDFEEAEDGSGRAQVGPEEEDLAMQAGRTPARPSSASVRRRRRQVVDIDELAGEWESSVLNSTGPPNGLAVDSGAEAVRDAEISGEQPDWYDGLLDDGADLALLFGASSGDVDYEDLFSEEFEVAPRSQARRKCVRRPARLLCGPSAFGCCSDGIAAAAGPFQQDCPELTSCQKTRFGCCPDRTTPAADETGAECPPAADCRRELFGCCSDNVTARAAPGGADCAPPATACRTSRYGCCDDNQTAAGGPFGEGCPGVQPTPTPAAQSADNATVNCTQTQHGCCEDGVTSAAGPDWRGCPPACASSQFGCCADSLLPAHGSSQQGCCVAAEFGCCPDNISPARGPDLDGCGCEYSAFGCCPDNSTVARGPAREGCGCQHTEHGCCPDQYTPATGPDGLGCGCHTQPHGCCADGSTAARGPSQQGCGCEHAEHGCCPDGRTRAAGPDGAGCGCETQPHGCCPDGVSAAGGDDYEGCDDRPTDLGQLCQLPKLRGPCRNFTVRWFFDMEYGGCSRFWYGGCQGNDNSFDTDDRCKATCVQPEGRDVCELPLVRGPCEGDYPAWYYQPSAGRCVRFSYGGCLGNGNRFDGEQECRDGCVVPDILDPCRQEVKPGPCGGSIRRWYFDGTSSLCTAFSYGGCKANLNNFLTEGECRHRCSRPGTQAVCSLPRAEGDCDASLPRWYFDYSQSRCTPFYYSGCGANLNHFTSEADCHTACPERLYAAEACADRLEPGPCSNFSTRYWYSLQTGRCRPFQYSGCDGNRNRFASQVACQLRCEANKAQVDAVGFRSEWCQLPADPGSCAGREVRWHYDSRDGLCSELLYSGCGGNQNRFASEHQCQQRCSSSQDVCSLPRLVGPCSGSLRQFYFDTRLARCLEFDFSGCQGNGNRFNSLAECEARCRSEEQPTATERAELERTSERPDPGPDDVCQLGHDPGPCRVPTRAWFFRASEGACRQFTYGGCGGNDNKFVSEEQCQRLCGPFKGHDACNTPPSAGDCGGHVVRWYFDGREGTCTAFAYTGCGGNVNRFATEEECRVICVSGRELQVPDSRAPQRPAEPEEAVTSPSPVPVPVPVPAGRPADCAEAMEHCRRIVCPMGVERTVDARLCERCSCYQPCSRVVCGPRERCIITQRRDEDDGLVITAACRRSSKPGFCVLPDEGVQCSGDSKAGCRDDADCRNNLKCCSEGCQLRCLPPEGEREVSVQGIWPTSSPDVRATPFEAGTKRPDVTIVTTRPDYPATTVTTPVSTTPDGRARIVEASSAVEVPEGSLAVLRCVADGNPQPIVTWLRGAEQVDTERGRYQLDGDGSLQIVGVRSDDAGEYTCSADNYRAQPDRRSMTLAVLEPTPSPARVLPTPLQQQPVADLGGPAVIRCHAYGWPRPSVTWWRDRSMLPLSSAQYRQDTSHALQLSVVRLPDLGVYTCQAYNGQGQAVAWSAQLRAHGPVDAAPPHLWPFLRFVVTQPAAAGVAEVPVARAPPRELDGSRREAAFPARRPADRVYQPEYVRPAAPAGAVPVAVSINLTESTFAVGAEVRIPCRVSGRPPPVVTWHKDGNVVREHGRTRLTGTDLLVGYAQPSDSGQYRCRAVNRYSRAESSVTIRVQGIYIDPSCTDNPFFANCRLIVAARYCSNNYYSRFCCRSCTLDGQLPPRGPHLDTRRGYFQARQTTRVLSPGPEVVGGRLRLPRRRRLHRLKVRFGSRRRRPSAALVTAAPAGAPTAAPAEAADPAT